MDVTPLHVNNQYKNLKFLFNIYKPHINLIYEFIAHRISVSEHK